MGLSMRALAEAASVPLPSHKDYEGCKTIPGGEAIAGYVRAGINANWLLTGEGAMLLEPHHVGPHEDMVRDVLLGDQAAAARREQGLVEFGRLIRSSYQAIDAAIEALGAELPRHKKEAVRTLVYRLAMRDRRPVPDEDVIELVRLALNDP